MIYDVTRHNGGETIIVINVSLFGYAILNHVSVFGPSMIGKVSEDFVDVRKSPVPYIPFLLL